MWKKRETSRSVAVLVLRAAGGHVAMNVGTKSVLYGAHCFFLHPWFVARAWSKLYGFPFDPRLWVAFFVHDLGYWGKPNMDGEEGEHHPFFGAKVMGYLFDAGLWDQSLFARTIGRLLNFIFGEYPPGVDVNIETNFLSSWTTWYCFSFYHSRFLAKKYGKKFSRLCVADKLAITITPAWIYLPMVNWTGEIREYMRLADQMNDLPLGLKQRDWYDGMTKYVRSWVEEHKDLRDDTWTPKSRTARDENGVWK